MKKLLALSLVSLATHAAHAAPLTDAASISAGFNHTCVVTTAGGAKCWGPDGFGELGDRTTAQSRPSAVDVQGLGNVVSIAPGGALTCALLGTGGVKCWGARMTGAAGSDLDPVDVPGLASGVVALDAGSSNACVLTSSGGVKCWGANFAGVLGRGDFVQGYAPVTDVVGLSSGVAAIAVSTAGGNSNGHACALTSGGGVKCWGDNDGGQLGNGSNSRQSAPFDVVGLSSGVAAISAGSTNTCALMVAGGIKCWGQVAGSVNSTVPVDIANVPSGVMAIASGGRHACLLTTGGGVKCWGWNLWGQLGNGTTVASAAAPTDVVGLTSGVVGITAGYSHTCAQLANGEARCWGLNGSGELGMGTFTAQAPHTTPEVVTYVQSQSVSFATLPNRDVNAAPFTVSASASSGLPVTFESRTSNLCTVSGSTVTMVDIGICRLVATQAGDTNFASAETVQAFLISGSKAGQPGRLANVASRMKVSTGDDVLIGGFVVSGGPKTVVVRARGPSLANFGIANPLMNPKLRLFLLGSGFALDNDDWQSGTDSHLLDSIGLAPADPREPALLTNVSAGLYTVIVSGVGDTEGVATVEVFEVGDSNHPLTNLSTRGKVLTGDDVMIAGFIVHGSQPQTVVINVAGPSLTNSGIPAPLANPTLTLVRSSDNAVIATNDDWEAQDPAVVSNIRSSGFQPNHPLEPAIIMTLAPGAYTAIVSGNSGGTGVGVVGVFAVPP
jgi:hypothetical protein